MSDDNQHGLSRVICAETKRRVRQECFFGCVICGAIPYDYEHVNPEFVDAVEHDPCGIALLCPTHHRSKGSAVARETIRLARLNPFNKTSPGAVWSTALGPSMNRLALGGMSLKVPRAGIYLGDKTLLALEAPEPGSLNWGISGELCDARGKNALRFERNQIVVRTGAWDVELRGAVLTIRSGPGMLTARLRLDPDGGAVVVERLQMGLGGGLFLEATEAGLALAEEGGAKIRNSLTGLSLGGTLPTSREVVPRGILSLGGVFHLNARESTY